MIDSSLSLSLASLSEKEIITDKNLLIKFLYREIMIHIILKVFTFYKMIKQNILALVLDSYFSFRCEYDCIYSREKYIFHFYISHCFLCFFFISRNDISSLKSIFKPLAYIRIREFRPSHQDTESDPRFSFDVTQISLRRVRLSEVMYMRRCYVSSENEVGQDPNAVRRLSRSLLYLSFLVVISDMLGELNKRFQ